MKNNFAILTFLLLCLSHLSADETVTNWDFDTEATTPKKAIGNVIKGQPGPHPPEFPDFAQKNTAVKLDGRGAGFVIEDPGPESPFDFTNGDAMTLEAWVKVDGIGNGQPMYIIGKGRTGSPKHDRDNQNWSLRIVGAGGMGKLSFLFATKPGSGEAHWHRWTSNNGFNTQTGWHHVALSYEFGKPENVQGWIDGIPTEGAWDLVGKTKLPPIVDDDEVWIGSSQGGNASNSFRGSLDNVAVHRKILSKETITKRFKRVGGPRVIKTEIAKMPDLGKVQPGQVLVQFSEGLPAFQRWPNQAELPKETARWHTDSFLLPRVPVRYDDWGIRSAWKAPLLVRKAADLDLPAGETRFLLRTRGLARLWVDGKLVAKTRPAQTSAPDGEERPTPLAQPPHPGLRVKGYRQQEVFGTVQLSEAGKYRVVMELIVGGKNQRTETGEICVAMESPDKTTFFILGTPSIPLTDAATESALPKIEARLSKFEDENRRKAATSRDNYWAKRHAIASEWTKKNAAPALPSGENPVDAFLNAKMQKAREYSPSLSQSPSTFHSEVLPILRKQCFRCHGEKDKGGLKLNSREHALKGGDSEIPAFLAGKPAESEMILRIRSKDEDEVMPPTGDGLSKKEIKILEQWILEGAKWPAAPVAPEKLIVSSLTQDEAFLRRVFLDTIGIPPSELEIRRFLKDASTDKRSKIIDQLLNDERCADHAMSEWLDLLAENPTLLNQSLNSTGPFRWFLHDSLRDNKPLDRMVTELILMRGDATTGGSAGFAMAAENDSPFAAKGHIVATAFLGIELQCARCHDSPYHSTTQRDLYSLAAMFERKPVTVPKTSRVPAGFFEKNARQSLIQVTLKPGEPVKPQWPFNKATGIAEGQELDYLIENPSDSRERLAALITSPQNQRFPKVVVNRIWKRLMGAGFVEPAHDWEGNSPSHPHLLDWLAHELVSNQYDTNHILRLILNSNAYQRESIGQNLTASPEERFFNAPDQRRLTAEQIADSLHAAAGVTMDSEELTFVHDGRRPLGKRQTFGKPQRAWMFASLNNERDRPSLSLPRAQSIADVLQAFGWTGSRQKPIHHRETEPNVLQPGILANGTLTHRLTRAYHGSDLAQLAFESPTPKTLLESTFLRFLNRLPKPDETSALLPVLAQGFQDRLLPKDKVQLPTSPTQRPLVTWFNHMAPESSTTQQAIELQVRQGPPPDPRFRKEWRETYEDLVWALINHREFVWIP